jgi:fatty acid desaturase
LTADVIDWQNLVPQGNQIGRQTSAQPFLNSLARVSVSHARADAIITLLILAALFVLLDLTWSGWVLCYTLFAINWSSLQYADHAFSPVDREEGAWNLKFNAVARVLLLNYHLHLNHHRSPGTPWIHLPKLTRATDARWSFWWIYLRMWLGPRPLPTNFAAGGAAAHSLNRSALPP